MISEKDKLK